MMELGLADVIGNFLDNRITDMYVAIPAVVIRVYDDLKQLKIDAQPSVNQFFMDETEEEHPILLNIPVMMPGTTRSLVSFPIAAGDNVMLLFCHRSIDNFKAGSGLPTIPTDHRQHSEMDAVAIPGIFPFAKSPNNPSIRKWPHSTSDVVVAHNLGSGTEVEVRLKLNGNIVMNTEQDIVVQCKNATVNATGVNVTASTGTFAVANATWNGNMNITGTWTFNGIPFNTHKHTGVTPGSGTSAGPVA